MLSITSDILESLNRRLLTGNTEPDSESVQKFLAEIMAKPLSELGISNFTIGILPFHLSLIQASNGNEVLKVDTVVEMIQFATKHEIRSLSFDIESNSHVGRVKPALQLIETSARVAPALPKSTFIQLKNACVIVYACVFLKHK